MGRRVGRGGGRMRGGVGGTDCELSGLYTPTPSASQTNTFFRTQTYFISTLYGRQEHFGHQRPHAPLKFPITGRIYWRKQGQRRCESGITYLLFFRRQMEAEGTQHREIRKTILDPSRRVIERNIHEDVINSLPPTKGSR